MTKIGSQRSDSGGRSYRFSHLTKGLDYDTGLERSPFDAFMAARESEILSQILADLFPRKIGRYLDFACGTGRITSVVAPYAVESVGIDVSETMVSVARSKLPGTKFVIADITRSVPPLERFDLATAFRFFGNAEDDLRVDALNALSKLVRPGGLLIANDHGNPYSAQRLLRRLVGNCKKLDLSKPKLKRLFKAAGFRIVRSYSIGWWIFRASLMRHDLLRSETARTMERISRWPGLATISPDMILVARKTY